MLAVCSLVGIFLQCAWVAVVVESAEQTVSSLIRVSLP